MSIHLQPVLLQEKDHIERIYQQYIQTFPPEERRNREQFLNLLENENATVNLILQVENIVGYIITWQLSNAIFIEHFEVFPENRGKKIGEKVLDYLIKNNKSVLLETEPDHYGEIAQRRINFYKRNGFNIIDKN